jgi:acetone carboxylase gamma subunit
MSVYSKEIISNLVKGKLDLKTVKTIMSEPKDTDRFDKYIVVLQERVAWPEQIILPLGEHLYIVQKGRERIVKCECGYEFGDYRINWKLNAVVYVRDTAKKLDEIYPGMLKGCRPELNEIREFYCPNCGTQLEVESVPPGYPITFDFLPDLDSFYRDWLGYPLEDEVTFEDKTDAVTKSWAKEG